MRKLGATPAHEVQESKAAVLRAVPLALSPTKLEQLSAGGPKVQDRIPDNVYRRVTEWMVIPCIDNIVLNTRTGKVWLPIRNYETVAPGVLWPGPGGRIQFGETAHETISRLFRTELDTTVDQLHSQMIAVGYSVFSFNGRRQTPNYTFVQKMDLPEGHRFPDKGHFLGYSWIGPEDLPRLKESAQTVHPYTVMLLEAVFSGVPRTHGITYHNEETGENVSRNRMVVNVSEIEKDSRVRLTVRSTEKPDAEFQRYIDTRMPAARLEALIIDPTRETPQVLLRKSKKNGAVPVIITGRQPYDERPEIATLRLAEEQTGMRVTNPFTIGVKNEIYARVDGSPLRHDVTQVRTLTLSASQNGSARYFWADLEATLPAIRRVDSNLPTIIDRSGILRGRMQGPTKITDFVGVANVASVSL